MPDPKIEDRSDAMEADLHKLEDHIADAEKKLEARKQDAAIADDVAGEGDLADDEAPDGAGGDDTAQDDERGNEAPKDEGGGDGGSANPN